MAKELTVSEAAALGGKARAKKLSKKQRSDAARRAVNVRWAKNQSARKKRAAQKKDKP